MTSDRPEKVEKWRYNVSQAKSITAAAFAQMVLENGLRVIGPDSDGYKYCALETEDGYDVYRAPDVIWDKIPVSTAATSNPAAGAGTYTALTVPAGKRWRFLGCRMIVTTDANVANRYFYVGIKGDGTNYDRILYDTQATTASLSSCGVSFVDGASSGGPVGSNLDHTAGFAALVVEAGGVIQLGFANVQAADDLAAGRYVYQEAPA